MMTQEELTASYTVRETRYGLFTSSRPDGTDMVTAATEAACRLVTERIHIPYLCGTFTGTVTELEVDRAIDL